MSSKSYRDSHKEKIKEYRDSHREKMKEYLKLYRKSRPISKENNKEYQRKWNEKHPDFHKEYHKKYKLSEEYKKREIARAGFYKLKFPEKHKARRAVINAINSGKLIRLPCENCGKTKTHAHHDDYSKPLNVRWLCPFHHHKWHIENGFL